MMSTLGLDLLDFINPDLTWNTVAKGYRSNSRRKPACRNFTMGKPISDKVAKKVDYTTISDTEKNGVDVLGRHFSGKVEHVPIKKRRFKVGSVSPPKQSPPSRYKSIKPSFLSKRQCRASDMRIAPKFARNKKLVEEYTAGYDEDFSGIEILAAVACDNDLVNDTVHANSSLAAESAKERTHSTTAIFSKEVVDTPKDLVTSEDRKLVSSPCNGNDKQRSPCTLHEEQVEAARPSRVHLDLNQIPIDAWESPGSMPHGDSLASNAQIDIKPCVEKPQEDFGIQSEPFDIKRNPCEDNHEASSTLGVNHDEYDPYSVDEIPKCSVGEIDNVKAPDLLNEAACLAVPEYTGMMDSSTLNLTQNVEVSMPNFQHSETCLSSAVVLLETSNGASQSTLDTEKITCENDCGPSKRNEEITCKLETLGSLEVGPVQLTKPVAHLNSSSFEETTSASNPAISEGQPVVPATVQGQPDAASLTNAAEVNSPAHDGSEELVQKSSVDSTATHSGPCGARCHGPFGSSVKTIAEVPAEDNCELDVLQADKLHAVSGEDMNGYDSQFEDGELREPDARYFWDENEDYVDYGSEDDEERLCSIGHKMEKKSRSELTEYPDNVSQVDHEGGKDGSQRDCSVSPRTRNSNVTADKEFTSGIGRIRPSNRESQSCNGRNDGIRRQDPRLRSGTENGSIYHRDEREARSRRYIETDRAAYTRGRSPGGHRFVNPSMGYWDPEVRSSPSRASYSSGSSRAKNVPDTRGCMMPLDRMDSDISNGARFYTSARRNFSKTSSTREMKLPVNTSQYKQLTRRTPSGRDEVYSIHRPTLTAREISPCRNNYGRFLGGIGRGTRNEHQRCIPEDNIDYRHRFARREISISPLRRGRFLHKFQNKKSRSRSRSRSPTGYLVPRERNNIQRFNSRSPEFRSNGRMDRVRVSFQKRLPMEYDEGFMSPPRGRFSPQQNSRCFDDPNDTTFGSFRGRKSFLRTFRQNQRFDSGHSLPRLNSDTPYRVMMHSRKPNDASRRCEYESGGDDDRRKGRDRHEMVQRVRNYDSNGVIRRFRYNGEDTFVEDDSQKFNASEKL